MRTYAFHITCKLAESDILTKEREILLALQASTAPIKVFLPKKGNPTEHQLLALRCGGFTSEAEARVAAEPVKTAMMLAGLRLGVGIDVGTDQVQVPTSATLRVDGQPDDRLQPHVHGLQIMPEIDGLIFASIDARLIRKPISPGDFEKAVAESYALNKGLTQKQTLAAQLYSQSHFQSSDAARFHTLISAIEALAERQRRAPATVALVERMIDEAAMAGDLEESERKSLTDGLGNLKRESISSACRRLVRTHCGDPAVEAFTRAYGIRGELLHNGEPSPETDLVVELLTLDPLVRHLILRHVADS